MRFAAKPLSKAPESPRNPRNLRSYATTPTKHPQPTQQRRPGAPEDSYAERVTGIEPALSAWEAEVLPLNYTRVGAVRKRVRKRVRNSSVKYAPSYE